jgi:S1-C subfamily serine protease
LLHAVVDIWPVTLTGSGLNRLPAASGREALELASQPIRGFIIDEFGHIITSHHRLGGATSFEVMPFNGRLLAATVVARDPLNGIAVLRLERRGLPLIAFGDSGALVVGDRVLTIGGESGADRTLTAATVLATGAGTGGNLAVDLTPTPERVGGPLLNHLGQAVGIVIDGASPTGSQRKLTFAVPVDRVKSLLRNLSPRPTAESMNVPEAR